MWFHCFTLTTGKAWSFYSRNVHDSTAMVDVQHSVTDRLHLSVKVQTWSLGTHDFVSSSSLNSQHLI